MSEHIKLAIADLQKKVHAQEAEVIKTKQAINILAEQAGMEPVYMNAELRQDTAQAVRSDQYYGKPLASAVREILNRRKSMDAGAASAKEIYAQLLAGGYLFDTKSDANAIRSLRISLSKNTSTFHKLPNGHWGLTAWYDIKKTAKNNSSTDPATLTETQADEQLGDNDDLDIPDEDAGNARHDGAEGSEA
ncbi:MAG: hypothetical protein AAGI72_21835 [Pseudomonadota bacterium]